MLTDALSKGGLNVPKLEGELAEELKAQLFPGASVGNPIDILATGTPDHLRICIDYCEEKLENVDAIMAIFGTPGLVTMFEMYDVLHEKMQTCCKPIFPVLPSINTAGAEVADLCTGPTTLATTGNPHRRAKSTTSSFLLETNSSTNGIPAACSKACT